MKKFFLFFLLISSFIFGCTQEQVIEREEVVEVQDQIQEEPAPFLEKQEEVLIKETVVEDSPEVMKEKNSVKEFSIIAKNWRFEPSLIEVNEGDTVKLTVESVDITHGISIPAFKVNENLQPGDKVAIEFVANKKGEFPFICSVFCGSGHGGMRGTLIVK
jgi:cytochrome c oxidase subunit II